MDSTPLGRASASADPLIGQVLGGTYRIARVLGRGGMGCLYEARHTRLARRFAVKVIHEAYARSDAALRRFHREADVLAQIRSDHVLEVVDLLTTPDERPAIVTEVLVGQDLRARLEPDARLDLPEALSLSRQICRGLAAAHAEGIVHRDLKPSNLFLESTSDGRETLKILDFGVAKLGDDSELTRTGAVVGTPAYMAPEQALGSGRVDARADVYSVGAVLYRMLTGHAPYPSEEPARMIARLLSEAPKRPRALRPDLPLGLEHCLQTVMARNPAERPASAAALEAMLAAFDPSGAPEATPAAQSSPAPRCASEARAPADALERQAQRARPLSLLLSGAACAAGLAVAALLVVGFQSVGHSPLLPRTAEQVSAAGFVIGSALIAILLCAGRWLVQVWGSTPAVIRYCRRLGRGLGAGLAALGALELIARGSIALSLTPDFVEGQHLIARGITFLSVGVLGALVASPPAQPSPRGTSQRSARPRAKSTKTASNAAGIAPERIM